MRMLIELQVMYVMADKVMENDEGKVSFYFVYDVSVSRMV